MLTRKMKDSGIEWIGEIPEDWEIRKIGNYFIQLKVKNINLIEDNLLSLSYGNIIRRNINTSDGLLPDNFSGYNIVNKNDIVLRMTDLQNDKRSLRTGLVTERGIITSAYITLRKKELQLINPKYIYLLLHAFDISKGFYGMGNGVRQNVNFNDIKKMNIIYPSIDQQKKIVSKVENALYYADKIIEKSQLSIEELKKYKQSLITEAVTKGLDPNVEMKDSGIEWVGKIPKQWKPLRIKYVLFEKNDKSITGAEEPLSMSQVHGIIPSRDMENIPNAASSYTGYRIVDKDDLVFNKLKAHLGVFDVSNYYGLVSPDYAVYKAKENYLVHYLNYLFKTSIMISEFIKNSRGVGAGLTRLYTNEFFNIKVPLPNIEEQQRIVSYLDEKSASIDKLIEDKTKVIEELEDYKKSLIYEYVTGKKEV